MRRLSSIFIRTPSVPTADLTTLPQKLAFSGNDASAYGCPKNALCLGGGSGPIVGVGVPPDLGERCSSRDGGGRPAGVPGVQNSVKEPAHERLHHDGDKEGQEQISRDRKDEAQSSM